MVGAEDPAGGVPMAHLMLPGVIVMGLLLMAQGLGSDVWTEKSAGTLSRMVSAPMPMTASARSSPTPSSSLS